MARHLRPSRLARFAAERPLILFFALAYVLSWLVMWPMVLFRLPLPFMILAAFGPSVAAVVTHRLGTGSYRAFCFSPAWPRAVGVTALGWFLIVLSLVVLPALVIADPSTLNWGILISTSVYSYSTLLGGPLGEEPGWRGYALPRLEARFGPIRASLMLGLLWSAWHLPLFFYPGWTSASPWSYYLMLTGLTFIYTYATNLAHFGVVTPIAMHAVTNTASGFLNGILTEAPRSLPLSGEFIMALSALVVATVIVVLTKGRLGYDGGSATPARRQGTSPAPGTGDGSSDGVTGIS